MQGVPVGLNAIAFWEDFGANGVYKGIDVDGHEVILLDEDTLNLFDQAFPFSQVEARLMLRPQFLDARFADKGGGATTHGVDTNVGLGTPGSRIDVLEHSAVVWIALTALGNLGPKDRSL